MRLLSQVDGSLGKKVKLWTVVTTITGANRIVPAQNAAAAKVFSFHRFSRTMSSKLDKSVLGE